MKHKATLALLFVIAACCLTNIALAQTTITVDMGAVLADQTLVKDENFDVFVQDIENISEVYLGGRPIGAEQDDPGSLGWTTNRLAMSAIDKGVYSVEVPPGNYLVRLFVITKKGPDWDNDGVPGPYTCCLPGLPIQGINVGNQTVINSVLKNPK